MLTVAWPSLNLREYVARFVEMRGVAGTRVPSPAHTGQWLIFYLRNRVNLRRHDTGALELAPRSVVIGPHNHRRVDVLLGDEVESFAIFFQPTAFYRLFAIPASALLNCSSDSREVLGSISVDLVCALVEAGSLEARVQIAEKFLGALAARSKVGNRVSRLTAAMAENCQSPRIQSLAVEAAISERQLQRSFLEQTGLSPKIFARVIRFNAALREKLEINRDERWTDIAQLLGYFDQSHMLRDFRALGGTNPKKLESEFQQIPSRRAVAALT
jgi:AraC-like DNA-binding protein